MSKMHGKNQDITNVPVNIMANNQNNALSSRFLFKNDFIRLKSLTFGYNVKEDLLETMGVSSMRVFLQGDNVWTWQSHKGIDRSKVWREQQTVGHII